MTGCVQSAPLPAPLVEAPALALPLPASVRPLLPCAPAVSRVPFRAGASLVKAVQEGVALRGVDVTAISPELLCEGLRRPLLGTSASSASSSPRKPLDCDMRLRFKPYRQL